MTGRTGRDELIRPEPALRLANMVNPDARALRRQSLVLESWRVPAILFVAMPVPLLVNAHWWFAPAWLPLRDVLHLYGALESFGLTVLLTGGIITQVAIWVTLAASLVAWNIRAQESRLSRLCRSRKLFLLLLGLLACAWIFPVYRVADDAAGPWLSLSEFL